MNRNTLLILVFLVASLSSCIGPRKVVLVEDMQPDSLYSTVEMPAMRIQKNDRLSISVSAKTAELAAPFNITTGSYRIEDNGNVSTADNAGSAKTEGYLVDQQGQIDFPVLGTLEVLGKTVEEVRHLIHDRLVNEGLINDPIVRVELFNLKVSVVGAVERQQVLQVPDGRINLLEAIARVGGLTRNAAADRVTVIREENGVRTRIIQDIRSKDLFDSPAFYLQQNDIVFVEGISVETTPREERGWRVLSTLLGTGTLVFSILNLLK